MVPHRQHRDHHSLSKTRPPHPSQPRHPSPKPQASPTPASLHPHPGLGQRRLAASPTSPSAARQPTPAPAAVSCRTRPQLVASRLVRSLWQPRAQPSPTWPCAGATTRQAPWRPREQPAQLRALFNLQRTMAVLHWLPAAPSRWHSRLARLAAAPWLLTFRARRIPLPQRLLAVRWRPELLLAWARRHLVVGRNHRRRGKSNRACALQALC
jgi:hypothetical protein